MRGHGAPRPDPGQTAGVLRPIRRGGVGPGQRGGAALAQRHGRGAGGGGRGRRPGPRHGGPHRGRGHGGAGGAEPAHPAADHQLLRVRPGLLPPRPEVSAVHHRPDAAERRTLRLLRHDGAVARSAARGRPGRRRPGARKVALRASAGTGPKIPHRGGHLRAHPRSGQKHHTGRGQLQRHRIGLLRERGGEAADVRFPESEQLDELRRRRRRLRTDLRLCHEGDVSREHSDQTHNEGGSTEHAEGVFGDHERGGATASRSFGGGEREYVVYAESEGVGSDDAAQS
mmetsp:Transcript_27260/g.62576  ORF Transcript_27260/g.62576 Transcript_27260/m.62576 type:complete len:285 (+) Transcript_27260:673-1527(+)